LQDGYGPGNRGQNPTETKLTATTVRHLGHRWIVSAHAKPGAICPGATAPVIADGRLLRADQASVTAYDAATGATRWSTAADPEGEFPHAIAVAGNVVVSPFICGSVSDPDSFLPRVQPHHREDAMAPAPRPAIQSIVVDGDVLVASGWDFGDGTAVAAYRKVTGAPLWSAEHPIVLNGRLYVTNGGRIDTYSP
jgi:putative pyrroloquinoline-quinone binding quinoprotein